MRNVFLFLIFISISMALSAQVQHGTWKTTVGNTDYHHFVRNGEGAAVYINQVSTSSAHPILKLSSGSSVVNQNVKFTVENNGNVGIGTSSPNTKLDVNGIVDIRNNGLVMNLGENNYTDTYIQIRKNSPYGVRFGLKASVFGSTQGVGLIQTGGSRGFAIKVDETSSWGSIGTPEFFIRPDGNVGIGTTSPDEKLTVKGTIHTEEVRVDLNVPAPDYVFEESYDLRTLAATEAYIKANKHLPEIPSAKEMEANGVELGNMNMLLLKKIEELTLYTIQQQKTINEQSEKIELLLKMIQNENK